MNAPKRLLDDPTASGATKELVGSLEAATPMSDAARAAIAARVAKSAVALPLAAKVAGVKLAGGIAAVVAGGAAVLSLALVGSEAPETAPAPAAAPTVAAPEGRPLQDLVAPIAESVPDPPAPAAPAKPASPQKSAPKDTLALEESLLEQARRATRSSPAQALALLREHEKRFPNGQLTAERYYLSARAHEASGNLAAARAQAERLKARFPNSTYLPRLRSLLAGEPAPRQ